MTKKQFKAESKRLLDIMINSIYTHKEIFLRELISNASDALDKRHYNLLTDKNKKFNNNDLFIRITPDKENRILTISDTGIGMNKEELESNLGTIAKSGSLAFKLENNIKDKNDIIGQFGVGFYSSFMIADKVTVISKKDGEDKAYKWESEGMDGYVISQTYKDSVGTDIIINVKNNNNDEHYDEYLEEDSLKSLIKKYSNFIKYPILMKVTKTKTKKDNDKEFETYTEDETLNSMTPIWKKSKKDLTDADYENFYHEQHLGYDKPLKVIHTKVEGTITYDALLYIPSELSFDFYTREFEKGLELYSNNVLIIEKCSELLPDYFAFVKGIIDSPDVSLNISRELLQHDKQLQFIAKKIKDKIKAELLDMRDKDRDKYETFFKSFGRILKYGIYSNFGMDKDFLEDLLLFYSSTFKKLITIEEYIKDMKENQKYIYYATGESIDKIDKLPQTEFAKDKGYDILYLTEEVDEFTIKTLFKYKDKEFKSVSSESDEFANENNDTEENKELFTFMKETLGDKVNDVKASEKLKNYPVCITSKGDLSIEMEKVLKTMPNSDRVKAIKILEINPNHEIFKVLKESFEYNKGKLKALTNVLYNQALLIEGLAIDDPVEYANDVYNLIK